MITKDQIEGDEVAGLTLAQKFYALAS